MPDDTTFLNNEINLEVSVEELLRRARPLPPQAELVIDDLTVEEAAAFLEAIRRR